MHVNTKKERSMERNLRKSLIILGCAKLGVTEDPDLKLYCADGTLLFDEDLEDDEYMKERLVYMCLKPPRRNTPQHSGKPSTPQTSSSLEANLSRRDSGDTWILDGTPGSTPESSDSDRNKGPVKMPVFSTFLDAELKKFGDKLCDDDTYRKVNMRSTWDMHGCYNDE